MSWKDMFTYQPKTGINFLLSVAEKCKGCAYFLGVITKMYIKTCTVMMIKLKYSYQIKGDKVSFNHI